MNVAIDISPTQSGHKGRGVGVYTELLVKSLQEFKQSHKYLLFDAKQSIPREADVVHYPYFDPFVLTLPVFKAKPSVVTVHDLTPLVFPDKFPRGIKGEIKWRIQKQSMLGAKRIITDSLASKQDILDVVGYPEDRIDIVYPGPSLEYVQNEAHSQFRKFLDQNHISDKYILYVGDVNWNKNITGTLRAFAEITAIYSDITLVLVGKSFINDALAEVRQLKKRIQSLRLEAYIRLPGFVSDPLLSALYKSAMCLVMPSFYEGFGFPVIDALSLGCPVVSSSEGSLEEIAGPSERVNPYDFGSIASGIKTIMNLSAIDRKSRIREGKQWSGQYTWKKAAGEIMNSYQKVLV